MIEEKPGIHHTYPEQEFFYKISNFLPQSGICIIECFACR